MNELESLNVEIERLTKFQRAGSGEDYLSRRRLEWERDVLIAERTIRELQMAQILLTAWEKTGAMCVEIPGRGRLEHRPHRTSNSMQNAYNAAGDAKDLAQMATEDFPPLPIVAGVPPSD